MPLPMWVARNVSKRFEASELERGRWPVLRHVGRVSGKTYRTPLGAPAVEGGYVFFLMYGPKVDWAQNVLAAGTAVLEVDGNEFDLVNPRVISKELARQMLPETTKTPPSFLRVNELLQMDLRRS